MAKKKNDSEEYLKNYLDSQEGEQSLPNKPTNFDTSNAKDLDYVNVDASTLPCGEFYPNGTQIMVRAAKVKEIQAFSMVDDTNFYDIVEKMNEMLSQCVKVKYFNGKKSSYLDIKDGDRFYMIFLIRELTFQSGNELNLSVPCECGAEVNIPLKRSNFELHKMDESLIKYFDKDQNLFVFNAKDGKSYKMGVPSIGLQKCYTEHYIFKTIKEKKKLNMSFLKNDPSLIADRTSITEEGIIKRLSDYENMDKSLFQFVDEVSGKLNFGIKGVVSMCSCGKEVRSSDLFRDGASKLFKTNDAFESFIL